MYLEYTLFPVFCVGADSGLEDTVDGERLCTGVVSHLVISVETQLVIL